jgi:putative sigma-54 modulation protein
MNVTFTARHFRPHADVKQHAIGEVRKLGKFYDGIVTANIILSFERPTNSLKGAEINLHVYGTVLSASDKSEDFLKSIDKTVAKLALQLTKYKARLRSKDKTTVRRIHDKV